MAPLSVVLLTLITLVAGVVPAAAHEDDVYVFDGSGWGHSIGLSQYGAFGQALEGSTYDQILQYYYDGISLETLDDLVLDGDLDGDHPLVDDPTPVWVGLQQDREWLEIAGVDGSFELCQVIDGSAECADLGWDGVSAETWAVQLIDDEGVPGCLVSRVDPEPEEGELPPLGDGSCEITVSWGGESQSGRITLDGDTCTPSGSVGRECLSRGTLQIRNENVSEGFHVMLELGVEEYMYGLGEMPSSWPEEALAAQAVAGRSYVVRRVLTRENPELATTSGPGLTETRKSDCWCHLYSTSYDQNYVGYAKESDPEYSSRWIDAVDATVSEVITHPEAAESTVVLAFYHSSSGGFTESNETVWGTAALPYLQPVADPWSNEEDVSNPYASWTIETRAGDLAAELDWDEVTHVVLATPAPDGAFEIRGMDDGEPVSEVVSSGWMYYAVGSRSPHFDAVTVERYVPFLDMDGTGHYDGIYAVWEAGISMGCGDGYFCPDELVTRAQMATFLARALGLDPVAEGPFTDIAHTGVHADSINAVAEAGISLGCGDGLFCPDELVTRAQMATFLARALGLDPIADGPFSDAAGTGHAGSINAVAEAGISLGCGDGLFCPDEFVNRAQMASFLARAFVWVEESEAGAPEEEAIAPS